MYELKITEKHNLLSTREGYIIKTKNILAAKKIASRNRVFQGTVLTIESLNGDLIAYKNCGEKWKNGKAYSEKIISWQFVIFHVVYIHD